jgi:hypothetical protein
MARIHGRSGRLYVGIASDTAAAEGVPFVAKWSISFSTDRVDVTALGDRNKQKVAGLPDVTGTYEGFFDTATAQLYTAASDGLSRRFYLYPSTPSQAGPYWHGTATFDFDMEGAVDDAVKISGDFDATSDVFKVG